MVNRERGRCFTAVGLLVVGAAVMMALLDQKHAGAPATDREPATISAAAPIVQAGGREERRRRHPDRTLDHRAASEDRSVRSRAAARELERAEAAASVFLSALLRRESNEGGSQERRAIARSGTRDLAQFVLAARPRVPTATDEPARTSLSQLEPLRLDQGQAVLAATTQRAGARNGLLVILVRREGRWLVAGLR